MPGKYGKFSAQQKTSADAAMTKAKEGIDAAGPKINAAQQSGNCEMDDDTVDDLLLAKANIEYALSDLGGRPCGGGRPC